MPVLALLGALMGATGLLLIVAQSRLLGRFSVAVALLAFTVAMSLERPAAGLSALGVGALVGSFFGLLCLVRIKD